MGFKNHTKINKKSVEVKPTNYRWRTEFDIKTKDFKLSNWSYEDAKYAEERLTKSFSLECSKANKYSFVIEDKNNSINIRNSRRR